jgi:hypothetical protein
MGNVLPTTALVRLSDVSLGGAALTVNVIPLLVRLFEVTVMVAPPGGAVAATTKVAVI